MHVVFLPKYYSGRRDPQVGEFIKRHAQAVSGYVQVSVVTILKDPLMLGDHEEEVTEEDGVWTLRAYYKPIEKGAAVWRTPINLLRYWRAARSAWDHFIKERGHPHLIHVHVLTRPSLLAMRERRRSGVPLMITEHSSEFLDGRWHLRSFLHKAFMRSVFRRSLATTVVSDRLGRALLDAGLVDQYEVVPNVLPLERNHVAAKGTPQNAIVVADLIDRVKNISGVLEALVLLRDMLPELRLIVVGGGADERKLREMVSAFNLDDRITFTGQLHPTDTLAHIARSGFLIVNSRFETFSVVTGEALMLGKPVIATRCGGPEAFIDERNGFLIPRDNTAALAEAIKNMVACHHRFDPQAIRDTVDERYSQAVVGRQFFTIYERVLAERN
ncbi:MAG: glycosyltransferase [Flavobacteriales bacterium]|nr:glycosyltransferase [Flavobacteriales bacterium]MBK9194359.1 glycosyltransferase [Flavobacteriales bacterium]